MNKTLVLHYQPGGRGDFLASSFYDTFVESNDGAVRRPIGIIYKNVHVVDDYSFLDKPNTLNIRISSGIINEDGKWNGTSISPSLQIAHNWFTKHARMFARNPHYMTMEPCEQYYHCAHFFCMYDIWGQPHRHKYDHWIDFKDVDSVEYVNSLRLKIYGTSIPESTAQLMQQSIDKQPVWQKSEQAEMIEQVRQLIDQELEQGIYLSPEWDRVPVEEKLKQLKG